MLEATQINVAPSDVLDQQSLERAETLIDSSDKKSKRGLLSAQASETNQQLANDSTERHIKFTLDLMQAIFSNQMYSTKTNSIESFLISPLSIQSVLMMMHLGSRGQTRRELANCLHLNQNQIIHNNISPSSSNTPTSSSSFSTINNNEQNNKLKRRHQQVTNNNSDSNKQLHSMNGKQFHSSTRPQQQPSSLSSGSSASASASSPALSTSSSSSSQQISSTNSNAAAHELFGGAVRNLLKSSLVTKALTSANQIFLQKNLPLSAQYEWAIRHYYAADVKLVDFQHQQQTITSPLTTTTTNTTTTTTTTTTTSSPLSLAPGGQVTGTNDKSNSGYDNKSKASAQLSSEQQHSVAPMVNFSIPIALTAATENTSNMTSGAYAPADQQQQQPQQANNLHQFINDWVERQTRGKISNFLSSPIPTSTLMMAINVLYFKGDWQYKFDPSDTEQEAEFTQANGKIVKLPMMVNRLPLAFAHNPEMKTSVIELPYKAQRLGLFLLLPDEVSGIFHTMKMLNSTSFANLISSMRKPPSSQSNSDINQQQNAGINVRIPKFSIESSPRLSQILTQQLGLKSLFSPDVADLSGMFAYSNTNKQKPMTSSSSSSTSNSTSYAIETPPIQAGLDELLHKAVLQVDEQGSVAAASSATIVERVGLFNSNYFEADHPFLLFLMDKQTGLVLFSGAFAGNNPAALV